MTFAPATYSRFTQPSHGLLPRGPLPSHGLLPHGEEPVGALKILSGDTLAETAEFNPVNVIFWGRRRQGKSLAMVCISKILWPSFAEAGWNIKSNIQIDFADYCHPLLGTIIGNDLYQAQWSLLDIDEITELIPSRRSMSRVNVNSLSLMRQIRKLHCEILCTTQFPTDVDKAMLRQLDLWVLCRARIPKDARWNPYSAQRATVTLWVFDLHGQFSDKGLFSSSSRGYFPPPLSMTWKKIVLHNIHLAWDDYNTFETVVSEHSSESSRQKLVHRQWDTEKLNALEGEAEAEELTPELKDWDQAIDARFAEEAANPSKVDQVNISAAPHDLRSWLYSKRTAGRFPVTNAMLRQIQPFAPEVTTLKELLGVFDTHGFVINQNTDGRYYAQV